jgi:integrase
LHSLADVSLEDIRSVLSSTDRADGQNLRNGLTLLAAPLMSKFLAAGPLKWNAQDVKALDFRYSDTRSDYQRVMPNELFRLLSNSACGDVLSFLSFIGYERQDKSIETFDLQLLKDVTDGRQMFDDYVAIREADRMLSAKHGKKISGAKTLRKHFKLMYGLTPQQFFELCARTQRAAFTVIALYTGARYSDLTTFTDGCLRVFHGMHVMSGTHVKHQALDAETGADLWPAIPVMRDAIACLKQIARFTFNPYLLSSTETVPVGTTPAPLSLSGYTGAINAYLREIDTTSRWSGRRINAHQLRHTLAHQLARADVGLMFIAHQMKHLHTALNALPPDVTMMYGNVGDLAQQRALHSQSAYLETAKELYDPSKPVAGGGAAAFMERRKAYFEGLAAHGWSVEQVLIELSKQGLPFASVGVGYCGGKRETLLKDGTKELPPCLGSLQCNPAVCHQAVITKTHEPQWQKILEQNRRLAEDPRMAHAKEPLLAAASTAESVLAALNPVLNGGGA